MSPAGRPRQRSSSAFRRRRTPAIGCRATRTATAPPFGAGEPLGGERVERPDPDERSGRVFWPRTPPGGHRAQRRAGPLPVPPHLRGQRPSLRRRPKSASRRWPTGSPEERHRPTPIHNSDDGQHRDEHPSEPVAPLGGPAAPAEPLRGTRVGVRRERLEREREIAARLEARRGAFSRQRSTMRCERRRDVAVGQRQIAADPP